MGDEHGPLTKLSVASSIEQVVHTCRPGDFFIFYFSGHGTRHEGADAYCFQDDRGQVTADSCMTDSELSAVLTTGMPKGVNLIILSDCCHSDTIVDFQDNPKWTDQLVVSMAGSLDSHPSGAACHGGIFTQSMLLAIARHCKW